ncbi:MAG: hypothetical protein JWO59_1432, partial [Chloroflexi bacterium]|nr:hypothetical protein [Chloroflexota bacterium]
AHADAPGLTPGKDLVSALNGGKVAFVTSDYAAGALPAGQVGWAPPSSSAWGGQRLIDGQASTLCNAACEWSSTYGTVPSPASPIDLIFTYASKTPKTVGSVMLWQGQYKGPTYSVQKFQVLVSTSTAPLANPQDYTSLKSSFKPAGTFSATVLATEGQRFTFAPVQARYLMIRILSNGGAAGGVTLGEVAFFAAPPAPPPAAGTIPAPTLKFLSATATAGSQAVALVVAGKNASVGIVIDYPTGVQVFGGLKTAGADGHLVYTWTIPKGTTGKVVVTVVSAGKVKQGTISVS